MRMFKFLSLAVVSLVLIGLTTEQTAEARGRKRYYGRQGVRCPKDFQKPPPCDIEAKNYKAANGSEGKRLNAQICSDLKNQIKRTPGCILVIGFRSCQTNGAIRGAARNSRHLCGKAADLRSGTCGGLGSTHTKGTGVHRHYSPVGTCN